MQLSMNAITLGSVNDLNAFDFPEIAILSAIQICFCDTFKVNRNYLILFYAVA